MNNFVDGFEKAAWNLDSARKAVVALKDKLVRRSMGLKGLSNELSTPNAIRAKETDVANNLRGKIFSRGTPDEAMHNTYKSHINAIKSSINSEIYKKTMPPSVTRALSAQVKRLEKGQKSLSKVKKPEEKELLNRTILNHDNIETRMPKGDTYFGHASPKVLLQENNMVATMPRDARNVKNAIKSMRTMDGSSADLKKKLPGFTYGKERYSRHAIRHMSDIIKERERQSAQAMFKVGFQKKAEANGLIGSMKNLASGKRAYDKAGQIRNPQPPKPGIVEAPRSEMPDIPAMSKHDDKHNLEAILPFKQNSVSIPKRQR